MTQITIIGAQGFIGSAFVRYLQERKVSCFTPSRDDVEVFSKPLGVVIYCAGLTADYAQRPFDTVRAHVSYLAEILEQSNFERLIYLSSTRLYDSLVGVKVVNEKADLTLNPYQARHLYDLSKALGESLCLHAAKSCCVVRLSCVYDDQLDSNGFLSSVMAKALQSSIVEIDSSLDFARDYVHINDVVLALWKLANLSGAYGIYNIASGQNVTNQQLFDAITAVTQTQIVALKHTSQTMSAPCVDITRMQHELSIVPGDVLAYIPRILTGKGCMS